MQIDKQWKILQEQNAPFMQIGNQLSSQADKELVG